MRTAANQSPLHPSHRAPYLPAYAH
jgi:hypothetical protein